MAELIAKIERFCILFCGVMALFLFSAQFAYAKTDLSITEQDITFSKEGPLDGELVRIYARVSNAGDKDAFGFVIFFDNGRQISEPQPISVKVGSYDDVFVDWTAKSGTHNIKANISGLNPLDENQENNSALKNHILVDLDTDKDGIGDLKDDDADNDGLPSSEEQKTGTNPLLADSDGDGINDKVDAFPKDKSEIRDADGDGLGDNKDLDDDGDGIFDDDEIYRLGTNPLNQDSDNDGILDKQETETSTNPLKSDTDGDGVNDKEDKFPLDPKKSVASATDSLAGILNSENSIYLVFGAPLGLLIIYLLFRRKKRRR